MGYKSGSIGIEVHGVLEIFSNTEVSFILDKVAIYVKLINAYLHKG